MRFDQERRLWSVGVQTFVAGCAFLRGAQPRRRRATLYARADGGMQGDGEPCRPGRPRGDVRPSDRPSVDRASPGEAGRTGPALLLGSRQGFACGHGRRTSSRGCCRRRAARRLTANTIVSRAALREDIARIRERGFAVDDEEHAVGLRCVAALVFNELREPMAAISISGPDDADRAIEVFRVLGSCCVRRPPGSPPSSAAPFPPLDGTEHATRRPSRRLR